MNASHRIPTRSSTVSILGFFLAATALAAPALADPAAPTSARTVAQAGCTANDSDAAMLTADAIDYPSLTEARGATATRLAVLSVDIGADDRATNAVLVQSSGDPTLDAAAMRHVVRQQFRARRATCAPVADRALVEYDFSR